MRKILSIGFFLLLLFAGAAQEDATLLQQKLEQAGFENIRAKRISANYNISFENNYYRWNVRAMATALDTVANNLPPEAHINIVQLRYDIPHVMVSVPVESWIRFRADTTGSINLDTVLIASYKTSAVWKQLKEEKPLRSNKLRFDLVFYPQFYLANLTFEKVYEIQFNIAPALEVSFWKGMLMTAQVIFPVYNDCKVYGEGGDKIRPGFLVISQDFRFPGPVFGKVSIGNFNRDRYGADLKMEYPFRNPRWYIGMNAGLTGYSVFTGNGWELGNMDTFTFSGFAGYFLPRFNLRFHLSAGRYIEGDYGGRFDLTRMFGETAIGFYASFTTFDNLDSGQPNAGFHVSIPFPPGKRFQRRRLRVNLPNYFDWEYNGATEFYYGQYYEIRPDENRSEHYFNPLYFKNELLKNKHW